MNEWWPVFLVADGHVQFMHSPAEGATAKYCAVALLEVPVELVPPCSSLPNGFHTPCSSTSGLPILFLTVALEPRKPGVKPLSGSKPQALLLESTCWHLCGHLLSPAQAEPGGPTHAGEILALPKPLLVLKPDHSIAPGSLVTTPPSSFLHPIRLLGHVILKDNVKLKTLIALTLPSPY